MPGEPSEELNPVAPPAVQAEKRQPLQRRAGAILFPCTGLPGTVSLTTSVCMQETRGLPVTIYSAKTSFPSGKDCCASAQ